MMLTFVLLAMTNKNWEDVWTTGTMARKLNFGIVPARFSKELYRRA